LRFIEGELFHGCAPWRVGCSSRYGERVHKVCQNVSDSSSRHPRHDPRGVRLRLCKSFA
jgi:hypothetical protein